jgi:hypothetical protein
VAGLERIQPGDEGIPDFEFADAHLAEGRVLVGQVEVYEPVGAGDRDGLRHARLDPGDGEEARDQEVDSGGHTYFLAKGLPHGFGAVTQIPRAAEYLSPDIS